MPVYTVVLTALRFGVLSAASLAFFLIKVVSILLNNLTWNPHLVGIAAFGAILPMLLAGWLYIRETDANRADPDAAPVIVACLGIALTILFCVGCVAAYLHFIAMGAFNALIWQTDVSPNPHFNAPSFAIFYGAKDAAYANFSTTIPRKCYYPAYNYTNCNSNFTPVPTIHSGVYGDLEGYIFDGSNIVLQNLSSKVLLQTFVNYNSEQISAGYGNTRSPQNPYLYFAVFDSALNLTRFKEALECGVIALSEMSALGSTTFSVTPYAVNDSLNALNLTSTTCLDIYNNGQSHVYYQSQIASTGDLTSASCDTSSSSYDPNNDCISQVIIRYATTYLNTQSSKRQKDNIAILIDIGGIVGGVCFLFWFLTIFAVR